MGWIHISKLVRYILFYTDPMYNIQIFKLVLTKNDNQKKKDQKEVSRVCHG